MAGILVTGAAGFIGYHLARWLVESGDEVVGLDDLTDKAVMDAVHNLGHRKTNIMIAHRLSTVRECDRIFMFHHGELKGKCTYNELAETNESFRAMASQ